MASNRVLDNVCRIHYTKRAMFTPMHITTRHLLRQYKRVIEQVKQTKEPAVVVSQKEPQVAIVSLDDLERLTQLHAHSDGQALLETARHVRDFLRDEHLPADLSTHHDYYLWEEDATAAHAAIDVGGEPQHEQHDNV